MTVDYPSMFYESGWTFKREGEKLWKIFVTGNNHAVDMTGSNVSTQLHIPFAHKILRIHLYHTDSSFDAGTDSLDIVLRRAVKTIGTLDRFLDELWSETTTDSRRIEVFGDKFQFEECIHTLILNSTNTDKIFPVWYVERL